MPASFSSVSHSNYNLIIQIGKSIDSVDGIRTRDRRMVVAGETMELG